MLATKSVFTRSASSSAVARSRNAASIRVESVTSTMVNSAFPSGSGTAANWKWRPSVSEIRPVADWRSLVVCLTISRICAAAVGLTSLRAIAGTSSSTRGWSFSQSSSSSQSSMKRRFHRYRRPSLAKTLMASNRLSNVAARTRSRVSRAEASRSCSVRSSRNRRGRRRGAAARRRAGGRRPEASILPRSTSSGLLNQPRRSVLPRREVARLRGGDGSRASGRARGRTPAVSASQSGSSWAIDRERPVEEAQGPVGVELGRLRRSSGRRARAAIRCAG